jgi:hypothetical protein
MQVTRDIVRADGVPGLWRGMGAHLVSFMPQAAVWWASYEQSKAFLARRVPDSAAGTPVHLAAGMAAGVVNTVVTNPLDTMKVRVQCQIGAEGGAFRTLANMVRKEGVHPSTRPPRPRAPAPPRGRRVRAGRAGLASLGKGLAPKIWMAVPVSALSSVSYEMIMTLSRNPAAPK